MKRGFVRVIATASAAILCLGLTACGDMPAETTAPEVTHTKIELKESKHLEPLRQLIDSADKSYEGTITAWSYNNSFSGIGTRTYTGESAELLARLIGSLKETEEIVPAICDAPWDGEMQDLPEEVEAGTHWYQIGDTIYRETHSLNPNGDNMLQTLAKVTSHYSEGVVLETADEFWRMFNLISSFHPMAYYTGSYADGTLTITHAYPGVDDITVTVKDLEFGTKDLEVLRGNKITLEITAPTDREITIRINSRHSVDLLGSMDSQTVTLTAGKPRTVTLTFDGWDEWIYTVDISAQNTAISILFNR